MQPGSGATGAGFKDYFSDQSQDYNQYRPHYPAQLFDYLASISSGHDRAWDCATGSGQTAVALTPYFNEVVATDASENQIRHAVRRDNLVYRCELAENTSFEDASLDLVTVSQALHWFDIEAFTAEVQRVLRPGGILAAWCYGLHRIDPEVDRVIDHFYGPLLKGFWPPERRDIEQGYRNVHIPLKQLDAPVFDMQARWTLSQLTGYLRTWSSVKRYQADKGENPVDIIHDRLLGAWGNPQDRKLLSWPLSLRLWKFSTRA